MPSVFVGSSPAEILYCPTLYGATDPTLEALVAKVQGQFSVPAPVVEEAPKAKKSKAATSDE